VSGAFKSKKSRSSRSKPRRQVEASHWHGRVTNGR
jgi:hypothetical protein